MTEPVPESYCVGKVGSDGKKENLINFGVEHNALFNPNHR